MMRKVSLVLVLFLVVTAGYLFVPRQQGGDLTPDILRQLAIPLAVSADCDGLPYMMCVSNCQWYGYYTWDKCHPERCEHWGECVNCVQYEMSACEAACQYDCSAYSQWYDDYRSCVQYYCYG